MISRSPLPNRQVIAHRSWPISGWAVGAARCKFIHFIRQLDRHCAAPIRAAAKNPQLSYDAGKGQNSMSFPFPSLPKTIESTARKTQKRGFAVCVNLSLFFRPLPRSAWLAVSRIPTLTARQLRLFMRHLRPLIMPLCAPSVVLWWVQLLPAQPAAAKPKVRLLARCSAACHAAYRACLLVTDTDLTAPLNRGVAPSTRPFGGIPRVVFLHFRAPCAHSRKGCYV
jgi:hypothetical protein